jgi:hypothetical protein
LKNPQDTAESGASGSRKWIATLAAGWSKGTRTDPGGKDRVSFTGEQPPCACPVRLSGGAKSTCRPS